jgi:hypothetical protein
MGGHRVDPAVTMSEDVVNGEVWHAMTDERAEGWQKNREREVDEHVAAGRIRVHADGAALLDHLDRIAPTCPDA